MSTTEPSAAPYLPRHFRHLGRWSVGPLELKVYAITRGPDLSPPSPDLVRAAEQYVNDQILAVEAEGHHGLGFVVLHQGEQGTWLLMDWWAHTDICCQLLAHAETGSASFAPVQRPLMACVWESVVLSFERDTWVETMLVAAPDPQAYLERVLPDGAH